MPRSIVRQRLHFENAMVTQNSDRMDGVYMNKSRGNILDIGEISHGNTDEICLSVTAARETAASLVTKDTSLPMASR